jgi:hypothetical protein
LEQEVTYRNKDGLTLNELEFRLIHKGEPIPWFSHPLIDFLKDRLSKDMTVFEYGCGNSTLWWADRVRSVTGVKNDSE